MNNPLRFSSGIEACQERLKSLCDEINEQEEILIRNNFSTDQYKCDVAGISDDQKEMVTK